MTRLAALQMLLASISLSRVCEIAVRIALLTITDGFFNPHTWRNYDPTNPAATSPRANITLDTHQFWAFPPLDKLPGPEIIDTVCNFSQSQLKVSPDLGTPPTIVGEWSLSTGEAETSKSQLL